MRLGVVLFVCLLYHEQWTAAQDCSKAPESMKETCEDLKKWTANARANPPKSKTGLPPGIDAKMTGFEIPTRAQTAFDCMQLGCLCGYIGGQGKEKSNFCTLPNGGGMMRKSVRREYRQLSDEERERYHNAILTIKQKTDQYSYDAMARIHASFSDAGGAHGGPSFLPWHREFIKRYEFALKMVDPTLSLPYWDSAIDEYLPFPNQSIIFSPELMGFTGPSGNIVGGRFESWMTISNTPLQRQLWRYRTTTYLEVQIIQLMQQTEIKKILAFSSPEPNGGCPEGPSFDTPEYLHGQVHSFVGGDMTNTNTSANDPLFFMLHSFADLLWEQWRQQRQTRDQRESQYPLDNVQCATADHNAGSDMAPFGPWKNIDGLSNMYTDNLYEYAPRPTCSATNKDCGSKYLWCMTTHEGPKCASKITMGGSCRGLDEAEKPCYLGMCENDVCVENPATPPPTTTPVPEITLPPTTTPALLDETCFNSVECCASWAEAGQCSKNSAYMHLYCQASCGVCTPKYDLNDLCTDRHLKCAVWSKAGYCTTNPSYMNENCRQTCGKCDATPTCIIGETTPAPGLATTTAPEWLKNCRSPFCYNENMCCPYWASRGECTKNPVWMRCNCKVSCGICHPTSYTVGACQDYDRRQCPLWKNNGACDENPWMLANCKRSCGTCYEYNALKQTCDAYRGAVGHRTQPTVLTTPRPTWDNWGSGGGQWDDNGWNTGGNGWNNGGNNWNNNNNGWNGGRNGWNDNNGWNTNNGRNGWNDNNGRNGWNDNNGRNGWNDNNGRNGGNNNGGWHGGRNGGRNGWGDNWQNQRNGGNGGGESGWSLGGLLSLIPGLGNNAQSGGNTWGRWGRDTARSWLRVYM